MSLLNKLTGRTAAAKKVAALTASCKTQSEGLDDVYAKVFKLLAEEEKAREAVTVPPEAEESP